MTRVGLDFDGISWKRLLGIALLFGFLFVIPALLPVEVQIVVESVGDVSELLATVWSVVTGIATLISFGLAVLSYNRDREEDEPSSANSGPDTAIHIDGVEGDLNLVLGEEGRIEGYDPSNEEDETRNARDRENT